MTAIILLALGIGGLATGILVGRYYVPDDRSLKRKARHADAYVRSINLMLDRDQSGAIDELVKVVADNVDDVEPYFALGALFRGRGEWERAIRIHQAIELREHKNRKICLRARYQLGLDFRAAGMPRRATRAMEQCIEEDPKSEGALKALASLYEEQGRFSEAAGVCAKIEKLSGEDKSQHSHHLLCAAAQRAVERDDLISAKQLLKEAAATSADTPHYQVAYAELAAAKGNWKKASQALSRALAIQPELVSYLAGPLHAAQLEGQSQKSEEDPQLYATRETISRLDEVEVELGGDPLLLLAAAEMRMTVAQDEAKADLKKLTTSCPELLPARVASARLALESDDLEELRDHLVGLVGEQGSLDSALGGSWRCSSCGQREPYFFWRCSHCRHWAAAALDMGLSRQEPAQARRERRKEQRVSSRLLTGDSLPESSLQTGLSTEGLSAAAERRSALGRAGQWLSGAAQVVRGRKERSNQDPD